MSVAVLIDERLEVPQRIESLAAFRRWTYQADFPSSGRLDFVGGRIEVDMSPEDVWFHSKPKSEVHTVLYGLAKSTGWGEVFVDRMRIANPSAGLSAEPDIVCVSHQSLQNGRVKLVAGSNKGQDRYLELEGAPDVVVEIVSDTSEEKDCVRLPLAYFCAGVREFWLIDARAPHLEFQIHRRGRTAYAAVRPDREGFQRSAVFERRFKLERQRSEFGYWRYDLLLQE